MQNKPKWRAVNMQFVKKEKVAISELETTADEFAEMIKSMAFAGYKVGFSFSPSEDCYILAITGQEKTGPDWNKSFMAFHSHFETILKILAYVFNQANTLDSLSRGYDRFFDNDW